MNAERIWAKWSELSLKYDLGTFNFHLLKSFLFKMCIYDSTAAFNSENYSELVEREISNFMRGWSNEE